MDNREAEKLWNETRSLAPIIRAARSEGDVLRRLPDSIARAFVERDVFRLLLPEDLGGQGIDPITHFDLVEEVSSYDGSAGWNYAINSGGSIVAGAVSAEVARAIFAGPEQGVIVSGAPQGRAVAVDGGYRVSGRFGWASGIHQSTWTAGGCFVFDGDERRMGAGNIPVVIHPLVPRSQVTVLDAWHVGGMRGTGSTDFQIDDIFVRDDYVAMLYGAAPKHPSPMYLLPPTYIGFALCAVVLGIARATMEALKDLAFRKKVPPPRLGLAEQQFTQYAVAKAEAITESGRMAVKGIFAQFWREICDDGEASMQSRAALRRAMIHATESSVEAVQMCYRAAGGSALFENEAFERALRDVNAAAAHLTLQRTMMEDAGRVAMGLPPLLPMF